MASLPEALAIVDRLYNELQGRQGGLARLAAYYDGRHNLNYASPQFGQYWGGAFKSFADNWCQVVVDSKAERLVVKGIRVGQDDADEETWRVWQANALDADSGLAFVDAIACGRAYALVWGNPDDDETPEVTFESATEAIVAYEPGSRRRRVAALKSWADLDSGIQYATLFLPDEVWKFQMGGGLILPRPEELGGTVAMGGNGWGVREIKGEANPQPNPMGVVPMVELPNRLRLARQPVSEIENVIPLQDCVNLVWSHLITASDFAAFPQRVIMGMEVPKKPVVNAAGDVVGTEPANLDKFAMDRIVWLEDPEAKIGDWKAADLSNYTQVIEAAVGHIAAQTRTPQHYLIGKMANLSGEALKAAETGLVQTVVEKMLYFGEAVKEICRLIALCQGDEGKAKDMQSSTVVWKDPESRSNAEMADALGKLAVMLHVPDEFLWRRYGFEEQEIVEMRKLRAEQIEQEMDLIKSAAKEEQQPGQPVQPKKAVPKPGPKP